MPVVYLSFRDLGREPDPHAAHLNGSAVGYLQHNVDIVDAAVDDRAGTLHQPLVDVPRLAGRLLVQVHAHDNGQAKRPRLPDELDVAWMVPQDVSDHELAAGSARRGNDTLGFDHARREGLFHEDVGARFHRGDRMSRVGLGVRIHRNEIRLCRQPRLKVIEHAVAGELGGERHCGAVHEADNLEAGIAVIGECMALAHLAQTNDERP
jgi:hypothetical protein